MIDPYGLFRDPEEAQPPRQCDLDRLHQWGVSAHGMSSPVPILVSNVLFDGRGGYSPYRVGEFAYVIPIIEDCEIIDFAAWDFRSNRIATRIGLGSCLGQEQIGVGGAGTTGLALPVWRNPLGWLLAERKGLIIADRELAAHLVSGLCLKAEDREHAAELRRVLRVRSPSICAPSSRRAVAA